jgi:hypothetical protein
VEARWNRDAALFHHTAAAKVLGLAGSERHWSSQANATARHRFGARPFRRRERTPKRARRGESVGSPSKSRFGTGGGNPTRFGCPSLKTKFWIARVGLIVLRDSAAHGKQPAVGCVVARDIGCINASHLRPRGAESRGFRYGGSRRGVQSRWFAKPKRPLGLCPTGKRGATYASPRYLETFKSRGTTTAYGTCRSKLFQ